ncbi:chorismate mutase [Microbulbifer hydrolyticus]|uniref:DUF3313 family protein n=1 Tax=Microbulbifer hydrolyticus TaxID=48074 RepID=A0A6P1T8J5_9GAMM|nr:chorismate mutase [Microbulbifer hydrolyticus]MBB5211680.1 hypothetical protein [Microbulbifer hydrolyticus]QHQ37589.1 hypothetical protein GTQ55_00415 [Microbulbifer hydrolyticus]
MRASKLCRLAIAGLLGIGMSAQAAAQGGFWGGEEHTPSLVVAPSSIQLDVPMPVSSGNLQLMLAQATAGGGLAELKQQAVRGYTQYLHSELARELYEYLNDEDIPLVDKDGVLNLQNSFDLKVIKHLNAMKPKDDYDLEQGKVTLTGEFRYALTNRSGTPLREQLVSIDDLKVQEKYLVRTYHDGRASEDNTEEAIKKALSELVDELVESMEDNLDPDELRAMAAM